MNTMIGKLAKADWRGKNVYGMVVSTHIVNEKEKVGFAFADPTQWVAFLAAPKEITEVDKSDEIAKALETARLYWSYELKSLEQRAAMKYDIDDEKHLAKLIATAKEWVAKLK